MLHLERFFKPVRLTVCLIKRKSDRLQLCLKAARDVKKGVNMEEKREIKKTADVEATKEGLRTNRIFVLDTNVLIHDVEAVYSFKGVVVAIPFMVLEELDQFKREGGEKGHNAREAIRLLDSLRRKGHLAEGVSLGERAGGSILRVILNPAEINFSLNRDIHEVKDNAILQTVADLAAKNFQVTLITKDINVRIKADALGLDTEDYTKGTVLYDRFYKGWSNIMLPAQEMRTFSPKDLPNVVPVRDLNPNEFVVVQSESQENDFQLFRYRGNGNFKTVEPITIMHVFNAKNIQQLMALDLLMDDEVKLMTLVGPAGTGKTFLALLAGLFKVSYQHMYRKMLVTRPVIALGADIGFLPGDVQEKLHYWMQPVQDNLEFIANQLLKGTEEFLGFGKKREKPRGRGHGHDAHGRDRGHREEPREQDRSRGQRFHPEELKIVERLQQQGVLSLEAITYMRGRSIPFQFVLIDEVQNLTPHEVKTIVSRAGEGTKVVLAGDPYQIDSPYLDFSSNGLTVTTEKFKQQDLFGTVFLEISERSQLAKLAAEIL